MTAERAATALAHARRMHGAGVRIAVATDAGTAPSKPFNVQPHAVAEVAKLLGLIPALRGASVYRSGEPVGP